MTVLHDYGGREKERTEGDENKDEGMQGRRDHSDRVNDVHSFVCDKIIL